VDENGETRETLVWRMGTCQAIRLSFDERGSCWERPEKQKNLGIKCLGVSKMWPLRPVLPKVFSEKMAPYKSADLEGHNFWGELLMCRSSEKPNNDRLQIIM